MSLQQLWSPGEFVRVPSGGTGLVRRFDRRINLVAVQMGAMGLVEALHESIRKAKGERPGDFVELMRANGIVHDFHFTVLRVGEEPS